MRLHFSSLLPIPLVLMLAVPGGVAAQEQEPIGSWTIAVGLMQFELEGDGLAPMAAFRASTPISTVLLLEGSLVGGRPEQDTGTSNVLIPEAQVQLSLPFTSVNPYMGLGAGAFVDFKDSDSGGTDIEFTISGSLGLRAWFGERFGVVVEFRGRGIGADFEETTAEYTIGGSLRR
jgi:hypothetical protein